ncbi:YdcF family protein [Thalassospira sp.]|uniref:YdcF family protein n=1 Tax=Thalassospira sp. TaxID=1912094 RepID=UPI0027322EF3|nr:YdcF family protein [Thalassospira sp.]MDP2698821.1 YdcF family protein [Thalassospira sp.]
MRRPPRSVQNRRRFRRFRFLLAVLILLGLGWAAGLMWYVGKIPDVVENPDQQTDAIIVLTGGSERLSEGRRLLSRHLAKKLFISGVYRGVEVNELLSAGKADPNMIACCVVLGHVAENTRGNALETALWVYEEGYRSLRVVTANYHMPRSLLEFRSVMPDVELVAHPVFPEHVMIDNWWRWPGSAALITSEYNKFLFAALRNEIMLWMPGDTDPFRQLPAQPPNEKLSSATRHTAIVNPAQG